jgi:UDP-2,3-diacylglucosamine pyrophosphatase LpxH
MLVILSDTHLTDGTSGATVRAGAFRLFRDRLRDLAYEASWRSSGRYQPIEDLHLVLLGDILDVIRSTQWLRDDGAWATVKPWSGAGDPNFAAKVADITNRILDDGGDEGNKRSAEVLRTLSQTITLPPATAQGRPGKTGWEPEAAERVPVQVHTHYLVGNHDWFYHLPGAEFDQIRARVVKDLGLAQPATAPFPHDPAESPALERVYDDHAMFARHGDIFDSMNFTGDPKRPSDRNQSSLGDAVVVELIDRFAMTVKEDLGDQLPPAALAGLNEIDNLRPLLIVPAWIDGWLRRTCPDERLQRAVKSTWDGLVDRLLELDFVRDYHKFLHLRDDFEKLRLGFKLSAGVLRDNLTRLLAWYEGTFKRRGESYRRNAEEEPALTSGRARAVVYGHTHYYEFVPLEAGSLADGSHDKVYINSGTWRPYHELTFIHPGQEHFVSYQTMTYVAFFKGDERGGRHYEMWSGILGGKPL